MKSLAIWEGTGKRGRLRNKRRFVTSVVGRISLAMVLLSLGSGLIGQATPSLQAQETLQSPVRLALHPSGRLLVTDRRLAGVVDWDAERSRVVGFFETPGRPVGVAWAWGKVYIGNDSSGAVEVYTSGGKFVTTLGQVGQVRRPSDIAVDTRQGLIFVTDAKLGRVVVYNHKGQLVRMLPAPGAPPLNVPTGIALDMERGEVLVSDFGDAGWFSMDAWVRIYDYEGNYREGISGRKAGIYGFSRPEGLAVNRLGQIYLVDSLRSQVLVFDRTTLAGIATIGEAGTGNGQLLLPVDVVISDKTDDLFVTNHRHGTVTVFKGMGAVQ